MGKGVGRISCGTIKQGKKGWLGVNAWQVSTLVWPCAWLLFKLHFYLFFWVRALCARGGGAAGVCIGDSVQPLEQDQGSQGPRTSTWSDWGVCIL